MDLAISKLQWDYLSLFINYELLIMFLLIMVITDEFFDSNSVGITMDFTHYNKNKGYNELSRL